MRVISRNAVVRIAGSSARALGLRQSERKICMDAQKFWSDSGQEKFRSDSHWRGEKGLPDEVWLKLGAVHLSLFQDYAGMMGIRRPLQRVIEWGCGGGANAIHFAAETEEFVGVDVSEASLRECAKTLDDTIGYDRFVPILVDVARPEDGLEALSGRCDLFLCTYVFELLPSPEYGERLLKLALHLLRPGGMALVQIKYETKDARTRPRRWDYRSYMANMTTYSIDVFWQLSQRAGFTPKAVTLRPKDELTGDERYAYFILEKPAEQRT
jgi:methylase of polypeptide subunit release factors